MQTLLSLSPFLLLIVLGTLVFALLAFRGKKSDQFSATAGTKFTAQATMFPAPHQVLLGVESGSYLHSLWVGITAPFLHLPVSLIKYVLSPLLKDVDYVLTLLSGVYKAVVRTAGHATISVMTIAHNFLSTIIHGLMGTAAGYTIPKFVAPTPEVKPAGDTPKAQKASQEDPPKQ